MAVRVHVNVGTVGTFAVLSAGLVTLRLKGGSGVTTTAGDGALSPPALNAETR